MNRGKGFYKCVLLGLAAVAIVGFITMLLWNWLIPSIFNGRPITYLQTLGLLALVKIFSWTLFGKRHYSNGAHWKQRFKEKISGMSPEERERCKARMKEKWCTYEKYTSTSDKNTSNV